MAVELTPTRRNEWAFVFALEREASAFRKLNPYVRIEIIGVGADRAAANVQSLIDQRRPTAIILAGYAGALRERFNVGDVIVAAEVCSGRSAKESLSPSPLFELNQSTARLGRALSVDSIVGHPSQKAQLGSRFQADCVDMESFAVANVCSQNNVPWAIIRVISDKVDSAISQAASSVIHDGRVSTWQAILAMVRRPSVVKEFWHLARNTTLASQKLAEALVNGVNSEIVHLIEK